MTIREDSLVTASAGSATWNWKGTGSSAFDVSLFTKLCKSSRETLAGKLTAGAKAEPSSSDTNWTTTFGDCSTGIFSGSGMPLYTFCRLGGGSNVAMKNFSLHIRLSTRRYGAQLTAIKYPT
jgi:hypothetical protein